MSITRGLPKIFLTATTLPFFLSTAFQTMPYACKQKESRARYELHVFSRLEAKWKRVGGIWDGRDAWLAWRVQSVSKIAHEHVSLSLILWAAFPSKKHFVSDEFRLFLFGQQKERQINGQGGTGRIEANAGNQVTRKGESSSYTGRINQMRNWDGQ